MLKNPERGALSGRKVLILADRAGVPRRADAPVWGHTDMSVWTSVQPPPEPREKIPLWKRGIFNIVESYNPP